MAIPGCPDPRGLSLFGPLPDQTRADISDAERQVVREFLQKFEIAGSNGYLGQNSTDIVVGLGDAKEADIVRMLWPTGVLQDEIQVAGDRQQNITETSVPWLRLVEFLILAAVLGLVAASWPARRAARLDVLAAIAAE